MYRKCAPLLFDIRWYRYTYNSPLLYNWTTLGFMMDYSIWLLIFIYLSTIMDINDDQQTHLMVVNQLTHRSALCSDVLFHTEVKYRIWNVKNLMLTFLCTKNHFYCTSLRLKRERNTIEIRIKFLWNPILFSINENDCEV